MILLTIPVFVPMFATLNLDLVWFGVLVVKYIGISLLTPPVGFNIYVVATRPTTRSRCRRSIAAATGSWPARS